MKTPYAGLAGMLLSMEEKITIDQEIKVFSFVVHANVKRSAAVSMTDFCGQITHLC